MTTSTCTSNDRLNANLAITVDKALAIAEKDSAQAAASFLEAHGAGFALICRVLTEPGRRRARIFDLLASDN